MNTKKFIALAMAVCLMIACFSGCSKTADEIISESHMSSRYMGIGITLPDAFFKSDYADLIDNYTVEEKEVKWVKILGQYVIDFLPYELAMLMRNTRNQDNLTDEEKERIAQSYADGLRKLCAITMIDSTTEQYAPIEEVTGYPNNELIKKSGDVKYYFSYADYNEDSTLADQSNNAYRNLLDGSKEIKNNITFFEPDRGVPADMTTQLRDGYDISGFDTIDLYDAQVTDEIFGQNKLTLLYIWQSDLDESVAGLAHMKRLAEEYKDKGVGIVALTTDANTETTDQIKIFFEFNELTIPNLIADEVITTKIFDELRIVPTAIFVNPNSTVNGVIMVREHTYEEYKKAIDTRLEQIKE